MINSWNILIDYLAESENIQGVYDLAILAGNSLPYLADELANLLITKRVKRIMVVGGIGHATKYLKRNLEKSGVSVPNSSEAEMYLTYFEQKYSLSRKNILKETFSTNSGANAANSLKIVEENIGIPKRVLLLQDPLLQRRIKASFIREWKQTKTQFTNYVPLLPLISDCEKRIKFHNTIFQEAWSETYFLALALGEIPRLRNNKQGYGPKGKNYIDEVMIPEKVEVAFQQLQRQYGLEVVR